jgi:carbon monoxide dehydrogenase subunit G
MKVSLNKVFPLPSSQEAAWAQLQDIETVARCMPGAEITEKTDDTHYKGKVKVKIGPVSVAFSGTIDVQEIDQAERRLHLIAAGKDSKGTSSASMDLTANIQANDDASCSLVGDADVTVNGKLASFGGRMMTQVADQILQQFADNFSSQLPQESENNSAEASISSAQAANTQVENNTAQPVNNEINGFKFAWSVLIGFFKSLFGKSS